MSPYLIPRQIFIGDPAVLVVPLPGSSSVGTGDIVLTPLSNNFPVDPDIDFHRIILERRPGGNRLLVEFTSFIPGVIELPAIEIGGNYYYGLMVTVDSLVDKRSPMTLSSPASSLAMPGTLLMLYGTMALIIVFIFAAIWFFFKGQNFIRKWRAKILRWQQFVSIKTMERRLHKAVFRGVSSRIILDNLSEKFKKFLSFITGTNCISMSARDFKNLRIDLPEEHKIDPSFLPEFFRYCDELRFSGTNTDFQDILTLLSDMRQFVNALEKALAAADKAGKNASANALTSLTSLTSGGGGGQREAA
jgi:uncharacterized membrane protein YgcG